MLTTCSVTKCGGRVGKKRCRTRFHALPKQWNVGTRRAFGVTMACDVLVFGDVKEHGLELVPRCWAVAIYVEIVKRRTRSCIGILQCTLHECVDLLCVNWFFPTQIAASVHYSKWLRQS